MTLTRGFGANYKELFNKEPDEAVFFQIGFREEVTTRKVANIVLFFHPDTLVEFGTQTKTEIRSSVYHSREVKIKSYTVRFDTTVEKMKGVMKTLFLIVYKDRDMFRVAAEDSPEGLELYLRSI